MNLQRVQADGFSQVRPESGIGGAGASGGGSSRPGGNDAPLLRLNLLRALQLHRNLALGIAAAGFLLALAYIAKSWPVYIAESQLYVQPAISKVIPQANGGSEPINSTAYDSFVQEQVQNASNPDVLINALHKLGPGAWQKSGESEQAAADRLGHAVEVARVATSYEVSITAKAKNAALAAKIANAIAASVVEAAAGEGNAGDAQRIAVLTDERTRIQNELNSDYTEQADLNKQLGMAAVGGSTPDLIDNQIDKTREELIKAQTDHDEAEARYSSMKVGQGDSSAAMNAEADDIIAADPGLTSMKSSLNTRRATLISQMANLTPTNPEYKQDAVELAKINANLDSMLKDLRANATVRIQQKMRTDLERTAGVESQLNGQLRQLAETAASATPKLQRVNDLSTDIVRLRNRYTTVDEQLHNFMLEDSAPGAVHLSVAAVAPLHPTASGILKKALPLALAGLILGLLAASVVNHLDPKVYIAADVEQVLGFAPMAVLPDFGEVSDEVASENLLRLSATIEHARKQGSLKSCIFTGTSSGTGVTTVAGRVRDILEAMGRPTVLLDSSGTPGPAERAEGSAGFKGAEINRPAAMRGSRSTALLQQVTEETSTQHESLVLTDAAPLVISAETEYLARFVDCAIVIAESGVTTRTQLLAALNALRRLDVSTVGFVLNRVGLAKADPGFRNSVREIENHRRAQSSAVRRTVKNDPIAEEVMPEAEQLRGESALRNLPVSDARSAVSPRLESEHLATVEPAKGYSEPPSETIAHRLQDAIDEPPSSGLRKERSLGTLAADNSEIPWWLAEAKMQSRSDFVRPVEPYKSAQPASAESVVETEKQPEPDWEYPTPRPGEFVLRSASSPFAEPVPVEQSQPETGENPYESVSKLNGLKGLLFSLGLKNLSKREVSTSHADDALLDVGEDSERTVLSRKFTPFSISGSPDEPKAESAPERFVTAQPEILPPREFVPVQDSDAGSSRRYLEDDVQTLPSKRGQYKRRG